MTTSPENPRFILGLKLRRLRQESGRTLSTLAKETGLSISYLSEIEKGKKYPKPEKILALSGALGVPFDELVSLRVTDELSPIKVALNSAFVREFPFDLFGFDTEDVFSLINSDPTRAGALVRAILEVGQSFDVGIEEFLLAALRAHQQLNNNYFEDLENAARKTRSELALRAGEPVQPERLEETLTSRFGYTIDYEALEADPELSGFRSVYRSEPHHRLFVNGSLLPSQRAFVLAREIGYRVLDLKERALTSSWLEVESFDQVLNNFRASYFSGALLLDTKTVVNDVKRLFASKTWQPDLLLKAMDRFDATPETYFTRLSQLVPRHFGLDEMYFLRISTLHDGRARLTKLLNTSPLPLPVGLGFDERHCRRWSSVRLLFQENQADGPKAEAQRSRFLDSDLEFLEMSIARPLALDSLRRSSVTVAWRMNERFRRTVKFWQDPAVAEDFVNLTCERCPVAEEDCDVRAAAASAVAANDERARKRSALAKLL